MAYVTAPDFPIKSVTWTLDRPGQSNVSQWTGTRTVVTNPWHGRWIAHVELGTSQDESSFRTLRSFFVRCKGTINAFRIYATAGAQNSNGGVTLSANAAPGDTTVTITGASTSLLDGQFFTLNGQLCCCTADQSGSTLTFEPPLRQSAASGTTVVTSRPYALVYLSDSKWQYGIGSWRRFDSSFDVEEAILETDGVAPEGAVPTLGALTFSATSFTPSTPSSGTIIGATVGSTITASGLPTGLTINGAARTWAWDGTGSPSSGSFTLTETLVGATGSPRTSTISYTITGALSPYLGQVATRSGIATGTVAQTNIMSRASMYAAEALTSFKVKFPAWHDNTGTTASVGSNVTYKASVEYPAGTFTQIKWAASASVVASLGGDTGLSDAITVAIPQGAQFWIRVYATTTSAGIPANTEEVFSGDTSVVTGSATDQTMSGTVSGTSTAVIVPLCLVQTTTRATLLILGDSRSAAKGQDAFGNTGQFAYVLGNTYGYINAAKLGAQLVLTTSACTDLAQYCSHVINGYGINSFVGSGTAAQQKSQFIASAYAMPGKAHIIATCAPDTTSTDSWTTLANQTPFANDTARQTFNTWARTVPDPYFACVDVSAVFESGSTGKWVVGYTDDGVHQNNAGCAALASSGQFNFATLGANLGIARFSPYEYSPLDWFDANDSAQAQSTFLNMTIGPASPYFNTAGTVTYGSTAFNGGPGYTISSGGFMFYTPSSISQNASGIMLAMLATWPTTPGSATAVGGYTTTGSNANPRAMIMIDSSGHPGIGIRRLDADTLVTAYGAAPLTAGSPYLLVLQCDPAGGTAKLSVNGVVVCTANYGTTGSTSNTTAGYSITNFLGSAGGGFVLGEYIGFNIASATDTVRQKLEGDMAWRRGAATTFLPNTHPYYSSRPPV